MARYILSGINAKSSSWGDKAAYGAMQNKSAVVNGLILHKHNWSLRLPKHTDIILCSWEILLQQDIAVHRPLPRRKMNARHTVQLRSHHLYLELFWDFTMYSDEQKSKGKFYLYLWNNCGHSYTIFVFTTKVSQLHLRYSGDCPHFAGKLLIGCVSIWESGEALPQFLEGQGAIVLNSGDR